MTPACEQGSFFISYLPIPTQIQFRFLPNTSIKVLFHLNIMGNTPYPKQFLEITCKFYEQDCYPIK